MYLISSDLYGWEILKKGAYQTKHHKHETILWLLPSFMSVWSEGKEIKEEKAMSTHAQTQTTKQIT